MRSYFRHPGSGILALLTRLAAAATFAMLLFLVIYILVKGFLSDTRLIQPGIYVGERVSDPFTDQHFYHDRGFTGGCCAPGNFAAIYLVEYAKRATGW